MNPELQKMQQQQIAEMRRKSIQYAENSGRLRQTTKEAPEKNGSFSVRLLIAMLLLAGFLQLHLGGKTFGGFNTETVIETLGTNVKIPVSLLTFRGGRLLRMR